MSGQIRTADTQLFIRRALQADVVATAATGLLLTFGADALTGWLGLPVTLMRLSGLSLLPFAAIVWWVSLKAVPPRAAVLAIVAYNALWAIDSLVLLASGWLAPTALGTVFVIAQAAAVGGFALLQWIGIKRAG